MQQQELHQAALGLRRTVLPMAVHKRPIGTQDGRHRCGLVPSASREGPSTFNELLMAGAAALTRESCTKRLGEATVVRLRFITIFSCKPSDASELGWAESLHNASGRQLTIFSFRLACWRGDGMGAAAALAVPGSSGQSSPVITSFSSSDSVQRASFW
ncbi:unnamed protein product [Polarella glacialis]|uniref:Uncharacterized protein n=1 Tax=Polarella glacialis TaxID=89957 RepID=A0A813LPT9_POLGL|nr:unnamed protein product [Polarella glacialis]